MHQLYYVATFTGMIDSFSITGNETFITTFRSLRKKQLGCPRLEKRLIDLLLK